MRKETSRTAIHELVEAAREGRNPYVIAKLESGWVALADSAFTNGHCVFWPDPVVFSINDLDEEQRMKYSRDVCRVGDALIEVLSAYRINYETMCNVTQSLHTHIVPRFANEPDAQRKERPALAYPQPKKIAPLEERDLISKLKISLSK
ncbi:MAG: HIT domain-containing protein [Bdellovibrionota bacterium]